MLLGRSQGLNIPIHGRAGAEGEKEKEGKGRRKGKETQEKKMKSNLGGVERERKVRGKE